MKKRCLNPKTPHYWRYGGAGIGVCERWIRFENFLADMGVRPKGTTLDRIDNSRGYEPGNCRWATNVEQSLNRRSNVILELNGERRHLMEWSRLLGIPQSTLSKRLARGWSGPEVILGRPR